MSDLPYFCHVCSTIVYIKDRIECPHCRQSFLEVYTPDTDESSESEEAKPRVFLQSIFKAFGRPPKPQRKSKTITSDRRNYAIGPEIDDIITRLREEKQIEENPATLEQKQSIKQVIPPENETCMVCLNTLSHNEESHQYPCNHFFHLSCSEAWLKLQSECPICRCSL